MILWGGIGGHFFGSTGTTWYSWTLGVGGGGGVWVQKNRDRILRRNKKKGFGRAAAEFFGFWVQNMIQNAIWEASGGVHLGRECKIFGAPSARATACSVVARSGARRTFYCF